MNKHFNIRVYFDDEFSADELWPDGDAPENPTVKDVEVLINQCGGLRQVIHDWDMDCYLDCTITDGNETLHMPMSR